MSTLTIRQLEDSIKDRLRKRAAANGISMEEEARRAIQNWVARTPERGLGTRIRRRFAVLGGVELEPPERSTESRPLPDVFDNE